MHLRYTVIRVIISKSTNINQLLLLIIAFLLFASCEFINKEENIPTYVSINSFELVENPDIEEGILSHSISDVWVYVDDQPLGAYELPSQFPLLLNGTHKITLKAGIKVNSFSDARIPYPFYSAYENDIVLTKDSIIVFKPVIKYSDEILFPFIEDFEIGNGIDFKSTSVSDTSIFRSTNAIHGYHCGEICLGVNDSIFDMATTETYIPPNVGAYAYLELDYLSNAEINVGIYEIQPETVIEHNLLMIRETDEWTKIYVNITSILNRCEDNSLYKLYIRVLRNNETAVIHTYIDNVKIVHGK